MNGPKTTLQRTTRDFSYKKMGSTTLYSQQELRVKQKKKTVICRLKPKTTYLLILVQFNSWHNSSSTKRYVQKCTPPRKLLHLFNSNYAKTEITSGQKLCIYGILGLFDSCIWHFCHNLGIIYFDSRQLLVIFRIIHFTILRYYGYLIPTRVSIKWENFWDKGPCYVPLR